ncbi:hypothetical protein [Nannocystis sp. SCPEA4]|uniref:hypothetical protein n=1 Tax=Nannocystis sp. SCPEA4 TaxID=2996787 RepID=UPI002270782A|nr:hypothetical protein [Nannocystis sp. SCPEA4]MCY1057059.1 hypothetical protein [Nannocystis sp. SCPEA4]
MPAPVSLLWLLWLAPAPPETASSARLPQDVPLASDAADSGAAPTAEQPPSSGSFFGSDVASGSTTPPPASEGPSKPATSGGSFFGSDVAPGNTTPPPANEGPSKAPPMPQIEELPSRAPAAKPSALSGIFGPKDRKPVSGGGVGFFDPGKLDDTGPGGSGIQVRGYLGLNFTVAQRTDLSARDPETGTFPQLKTLPYFGGGAANLYVGAPIYSDVVYARIAFEFISIPRASPVAPDVTPNYMPIVLMEAAALEVNPFAWAKKGPRWFAEGFKISGGVFIVPFGLEDEEHDAPVRWWVTRPLAMSIGRVYPGSWIDMGLTIKWKPTFGGARPIRPLEIDLGVVNGDACTQTRTMDALYRYQPVGQTVPPCERQLREVEVPRGDGFVLGITPDNNGNKSLLARLQIRPVPALNFGGSYIWGTHPQSQFPSPQYMGKGYPDTVQAATWRVGAHFDLNLDEVVASRFPLPHLRAEFVYGVDKVARAQMMFGDQALADRHMLGGYAQVAQPLWRRKKTRLPGLIVQYRFDFADPDRDVPRRTQNGNVLSDFADRYLYDEALQAHVVGLRFPVLPRFNLKGEYMFVLEEGGRSNRVYNDAFSLQAVADF